MAKKENTSKPKKGVQTHSAEIPPKKQPQKPKDPKK